MEIVEIRKTAVINHMMPRTRIYRLHFVADSVGLQLHVGLAQTAPKATAIGD